MSLDDNQEFVNWSGQCTYKDPWFRWFEGNISSKYPDDAMIRKMHEIATKLNAVVQGDDGELYDAEGKQIPEEQQMRTGGKSWLRRLFD